MLNSVRILPSFYYRVGWNVEKMLCWDSLFAIRFTHIALHYPTRLFVSMKKARFDVIMKRASFNLNSNVLKLFYSDLKILKESRYVVFPYTWLICIYFTAGKFVPLELILYDFYLNFKFDGNFTFGFEDTFNNYYNYNPYQPIRLNHMNPLWWFIK